MAYYINGKTYTDHPLMDEICYNCKLILKSIVIKNDTLANSCETENSMAYADMYIIKCEDGSIPFEAFTFSYDFLLAYYKDPVKARQYSRNKLLIPESDRAAVTEAANKYFDETFEEENEYYRMLIGLPPFIGKNTDGSNIYDISYESGFKQFIPDGYDTSIINEALPLHKQDKNFLKVMYSTGKMEELRASESKYASSKYAYLNFLGNKSVDLYTARKASKWDIIYMPDVYYLVENRFKAVYAVNRVHYIQHTFQEFYAQSSEYYDQMMIVALLSQTFTDMITEVPEWYIRRDIFDIRSCQYFLESYGVKFFKEIPLKYQIRIVKNINRLIKYKSCNLNNEDIIDIFVDEGIYIYKYWLFKKWDSSTQTYDLEFISSKVGDSYDTYIKDNRYRTPYDDITLQDKYWDGEDTHEYVYNQIKDLDFTVRGTKYMSIEYQVSMSEYLMQMEYFLGSVLDSKININDIQISIPSIDELSTFKLSDLFLFLVIMTNSFYRTALGDDATKIRYVEPKTYQPDFNLNTLAKEEAYGDWKKKYFPEFYAVKTGRVYMFNTALNKEALKKVLERRHSHFKFGNTEDNITLSEANYKTLADTWINEIGVDAFVPSFTNDTSKSMTDNLEDFVSYYRNNRKCYDILQTALKTCQNDDDRMTLSYVFQELYTRDFDKDLYMIANDDNSVGYAEYLEDILKRRDYILYNLFITIMNESNMDSRQDLLRQVMNDVVDTLEYYLHGDGLEYICSFTTIESFNAIVYYIYLMIQFFKSFKVYFLDPYITLNADDSSYNGNLCRPMDNVREWNFTHYKWDKALTNDIINGFHTTRIFSDEAYSDYSREVMDIYGHYDLDPLSDYIYDGLNAEDGESEGYYDANGGVADDAKNLPYKTLNGGTAYLGLFDWENVNGGEANEYNRDYYVINGGYAYCPDDEKTDAMGKQMFNYNIDGGCANGRRFITSSMDIKLVGTELIPTAKISDMENYIQLYDDGFYLADSWANISDMLAEKEAIDALSKEVSTKAVGLLADIKVLKDENLLKERITTIRDSITYNMEYVNAQMANNTFINRMKAFVDESVADFNSKFTNLNPYDWEVLD